jgi:hypothetical protein
MAEDGIIPARYPLIPLPNGGYRQRTRLNVSDSDGTTILYNESLKGGTRLTRNLCALLKRTFILINAAETPDYSAMRLIALCFPCCAQARGVLSVYSRSTHASHPSLALGAAVPAFYDALRRSRSRLRMGF